ncbi:MAG TPA: outer membrane beta-barrel protein [Vicinamibacterales bacterium]|nr:outer membrane beta-barrel protein [Vicinamibacterales bacterium]
MKRTTHASVVGLLLLATSASVAAQSRVPDAGMWGFGGSIGANGPADASLQTSLDLTGNIERYLTPRVSIRGQVGAAWWDITGRTFTGTVTPVFFDGNLVYNWEGGAVHPYVTGGVGVYHFHASEAALGGSDTKPGVDLGGGIEFFFHRHATMTGELTYHKIGAFNSPLTTFNDGSFWRFGIGAKVYTR